jgi:hypothetical protein
MTPGDQSKTELRGNRFPLPKTPEERAAYVAMVFHERGLQAAKKLAVQMRLLRADFLALKAGDTIMSCKTWTQFCTSVLKRTVRAIRYRMAEGNPRWKRKGEKYNWKNDWKGMPEFEQPDETAFQRIVINFPDQQAVNDFAKLVGQQITGKTRYVWFPQQEEVSTKDMRWASREESKEEAA